MPSLHRNMLLYSQERLTQTHKGEDTMNHRSWAALTLYRALSPPPSPSTDLISLFPFMISPVSSDELMDEPVKRHSDAIFTDNYSRFRKQMAVKKYLNSVLTGKRR